MRVGANDEGSLCTKEDMGVDYAEPVAVPEKPEFCSLGWCQWGGPRQFGVPKQRQPISLARRRRKGDSVCYTLLSVPLRISVGLHTTSQLKNDGPNPERAHQVQFEASTKARIHRSVLVDCQVFSCHGHRLERLRSPRREVEDVLEPHDRLLVLRSVGRASAHEAPRAPRARAVAMQGYW